MDEKSEDYGLNSLSAIISLTNLLEDLPLPISNENNVSKSLFELNDVNEQEIYQMMNTQIDNDSLIEKLTDAMTNTDTADIDLLDGYNNDNIDLSCLPPLMKSVFMHDSLQKLNFKINDFKSDLINNFVNDENLSSRFVKNCKINIKAMLPLSKNDKLNESPNKHKRDKKHKKKKKHKSEKKRRLSLDEENQYSIKKATSDSQKIVLSLVKVDDQQQSQPSNPNYQNNQSPRHHHHHRSSSEKKHKNKHHKKNHRQRDRSKDNTNHKLLLNNMSSHEPLEKIKLKVIRNGDNAQIVSSTIPSPNKLPRCTNNSQNICDILSQCSPRGTSFNNNGYCTPASSTIIDRISQCSTSSMPITDCNPLQFTNTNSSGSGYSNSMYSSRHNNNTIPSNSVVGADDQFDLSLIPLDITDHKTDFLFQDMLNSDDLLSPTNVSNVESFLLDEFDVTHNNNSHHSHSSQHHNNSNSSHHAISHSTVNMHNNNNSNSNSSLMPLDHSNTGGLASYLSNGMKPLNDYESNNIYNHESIGNISSNNNNSSSRHNFSSSSINKRSRRTNRRKNELEGLKTWFIGNNAMDKKDPNQEASEAGNANQETTWEKTLTSLSHSISDKVQKRKRHARNPNQNSAFIFDNDEEYSKATTAIPAETNSDEELKRTLRTVNSTTYIGMDEVDENDDDDDNLFKFKRRKKDDDEPFEMKLKDPNEIKYPHLKKSAQENRKKRRERVVELTKLSNTSVKNNVLPSDMLDPSLITESTTYQQFIGAVDGCLELVEDVDLSQLLRANEEHEEANTMGGLDTSESYLPSDALISRDQLQLLCNNIAKLKATNSTKDLPMDKLSRFGTLLMLNIRSGIKVCLPSPSESEKDESQNRLFKELAMERIGRSLDSSFIAMNIMTSSDMDKEVYIEEVIDSAVSCVKYHLNNLVFPEYDPAYRAANTNKDNQMSIKWKRARERESVKSRSIIYFYNRIVDIISCLSELVTIQNLTDTIILQLSTIAVSVFFVENVYEIQLVALRLITIIFSRYEKHRDLIVKDIFSSLSRLPSSKKNLRNYRLNSEESIQMLTALALLLVQSVVNVEKIKPAGIGTATNSNNNNELVDANEIKTTEELQDREVFIENSYNNSLQTAYSFLNTFLTKATSKGEDDYKMIFDNFVTDLLLTVNKPEWPAAETMLSLLGSLLMKQFTNKQCDQNTRVTCIDYMGTVAATLRRDAVSSTINDADIDNVIVDLIHGTRSSSDEEDDDDDDEEDEEADDDEEEHDDNFDVDSNSSEKIIKKSKTKSKSKSPKKANKEKQPARDISLKHVDKVQVLRDALLDYLEVDKYDLTSKFARQFYFGQWFCDCSKELKNQTQKSDNKSSDNKSSNKAIMGSSNTSTSKSSRQTTSGACLLQLTEDRKRHLLYKMFGDIPLQTPKAANSMVSKKPMKPQKKSRSKDDESSLALKNSNQPFQMVELKGTLDYEDACLACRYLASLRVFSQSFDIYITKICRLLCDNSVAVRTKSMRCLSTVVDADPGILARKDIEACVHRRFLDSSTSVREAAVELVGKYLLSRGSQLIAQYYPMIAERILDKGTSVRKRVIRIFRDICIEHSEFSKIPEICVKMIRRINDEESIKKLVNEVFQNMWFCPVKERDTVKLLQKVMNITDVVSACSSIGYEWFDQLLECLLKREDTSNTASSNMSTVTSDKIKLVEKACKQIVDCLVQNIMRLEEISAQTNERLVSCLATLYLFTKIRPSLMLQHAVTLQPYLNLRKTSQHDIYIIHYVTRILELTVPLIEHPSDSFISQLEEDMVTLMMTHGKMVLESCVACFAATVNKISNNYPLVKECFQRLYYNLKNNQKEGKYEPHLKPLISRSLFTVGLLCKHFDFNMFNLHPDINNQVFETLMYYAEDISLPCDIRTKAISGIGFLCVRHKEILCSERMVSYYQSVLLCRNPNGITRGLNYITDYSEIVCCILDNISLFLVEEDHRMRNMDSTWKSNEKKESLKEMGDMLSGVGSRVAQLYLNSILENILQPWTAVRIKAVNLISLIIRQGLINPITSVPYLIAAQTDPNSANRVKADNELMEIDKRCVGFVNIKSVQGLKLSCQLQEMINLYNKPECHSNWFVQRHNTTPIIVRGILDPMVEIPLSLNHNLYTMVRSNKQTRRAFLYALLAIFDDARSNLSLLIYVSDNLAQFPYQSQEEPLYLVHQIDILVSSLGPNHLHHIKNALYPELIDPNSDPNPANPASSSLTTFNPINTSASALAIANKRLDTIKIDDDDDVDSLQDRVLNNPGSLIVLRNSIRASRGCLLLIALKCYLRELYSLTDAKVQKYAPSDSGKAWERQLTRRGNVKFDPIKALELSDEGLLQEEIYLKILSSVSKQEIVNLNEELFPNEIAVLIQKYFHLRHLVLKLDSLDIDGDSDDEQLNKLKSNVAAVHAAATGGGLVAVADGEGEATVAGEAGININDPSYQSAVAQGNNLRVELDKLEPKVINQIINAKARPREWVPFNTRRTLVPRLPIASSDEESVELLRDRRGQAFLGRNKRLINNRSYASGGGGGQSSIGGSRRSSRQKPPKPIQQRSKHRTGNSSHHRIRLREESYSDLSNKSSDTTSSDDDNDDVEDNDDYNFDPNYMG